MRPVTGIDFELAATVAGAVSEPEEGGFQVMEELRESDRGNATQFKVVLGRGQGGAFRRRGFRSVPR